MQARSDVAVLKIGLLIAQKADSYDEFVELQEEHERVFMDRLVRQVKMQ